MEHHDDSSHIVLRNVSKFYGEVLGINGVNLRIPPGITSLVGPNGSGKSTLMNLITGLLAPTDGTIRVLGLSPWDAERLFGKVGYCAQFDSFPRGLNGRQFIESYLRVHGMGAARAKELARAAIDRVGMADAAHRRIAAYSKGMRQRIKLAQAIAHQPQVLILDEPLNGLDPMARAEVIALFQDLAGSGMHVIISSHILHEVDLISDCVILLNEGYVVAEGSIRNVRSEIRTHPLQILVRCADPGGLAAEMVRLDHVAEIRMHDDRGGLLVKTRDPESFYAHLNRVIVENDLAVETVTPADEDVNAVYQYLIGREDSPS